MQQTDGEFFAGLEGGCGYLCPETCGACEALTPGSVMIILLGRMLTVTTAKIIPVALLYTNNVSRRRHMLLVRLLAVLVVIVAPPMIHATFLVTIAMDRL